MKNFLNTFLACLAAIVASSILLSIITFVMFAGVMAAFSTEETAYVEPNSILKIELTDPIIDSPSTNPMSSFNPYTMSVTHSMGLLSVLNAIERAESDPNIEGIYLNVSSVPTGMASMEEIRNALLHFKESGKFIISYATYYSQGAYYLSTVADKLYLHPEGALDWRGMASQAMFFKGTLDKLGIKPEIYRVGEFKSAVEPFMLDKMSPANREQTEVMLGSIWGNLVEDIAASRKIEPALLQRYASDLAVVDPQRAVELNMADGVLYNDQVMSELAVMTDLDAEDDPEFITLADYLKAPVQNRARKLSRNKVSVIYAEGDIVDGSGSDGSIYGETLAAKLAEVRKDDDIKAVVLRVNSPGGSALASDLIWREMTLLQEEKPIIVSMGDYAASGGYYISCPADVILADKNTLTGSIGVFGVMMNIGDALKDKLGVTTDVVKTNPAGDLGNMFRGQTPAERAYIQHSVEQVYETFVSHVAEGRNLTEERVRQIGGGRVWSGINAQEIGLIDGFGGLKEAIALAADRAGVAEDFRVVTPTDELDQISQLLNLFLTAKTPALPGVEAELLKEYRSMMRMVEYNGVQARMPYIPTLY